MFFGSDRLHFVERALGNPRAQMPRFALMRTPTTTTTAAQRKTVRFFFDL